MTIEQPEALLMAEVLKADGWPSVAAKLQQLHFENQGQAERIQDIYKQLNDTEKEVDDLRLLLQQALDALAASDDFLFNHHECDLGNGRELAALAEVRGNNYAAIERLMERLK